jgi:hypothetical protein
MSSKKTSKKSTLSVEQKRLKAIEYAFWAGKLFEPEYFDKASKAIAKKDKDAFLKIAKDAGIPQDVLDKFTEDVAPIDFSLDGWGGWGGWGSGWGFNFD